MEVMPIGIGIPQGKIPSWYRGSCLYLRNVLLYLTYVEYLRYPTYSSAFNFQISSLIKGKRGTLSYYTWKVVASRFLKMCLIN